MIAKLGGSSEYPITRPKAPRGSIRAKIITRIAKEFGVTLSMAERCWKAYRRMRRREALLISTRNPKAS